MSTQSTVRISERSQKLLKEFANEDKKSMSELLDNLLEQERRKRFFDELDAAYIELRSDATKWAEELAERQEWDCTLIDGLKKEEQWD
ncbi:MAG: toxin-antitoxin system protein [Blastocatellia bacterium]|nr:toxin-antitoxin system protein [Blastocatellia bacterium]